MLTETLVLTAVGAVAGAVLAYGSVRLLQSMGAALPAPATRQTRQVADDALREGGGVAPASALQLRGGRTGRSLVMIQVCLATVLLVCGALLARSFVNVASVNSGYDYDVENVLTFQVILPAGASAGTLRDELLERFAVLPGVEAATFTDQLPMSVGGTVVHLRTSPAPVAGPPPPPPPGGSMRPEFPTLRTVGPRYLEVLGIVIREGRGFSEEGRPGPPREALIGRSLAESGYLGARPVGMLVYLNTPVPLEVVGVVDDLRLFGLDQTHGPQLFVRADGSLPPRGTGATPLAGGRGAATLPAFMLRIDGNPRRAVEGAREAVRGLQPDATVGRVATLAEVVSNTLVRPRLYTALLAVFAGLATMLAVVGIYGLVTYSVRVRVREIGMRMAFGAAPGDIIKLIVGRGRLLAAAGILADLAGAAAASRNLDAMLYGLSSLDAGTYATVAALFRFGGIGGVLDSCVSGSARDPATTLRCD